MTEELARELITAINEVYRIGWWIALWLFIVSLNVYSTTK